jgi:hypothetical protein
VVHNVHQEAAALVKLFHTVQPGEESLCDAHVSHPSDEVSHNLLAQTLHFANQVLLATSVLLDLNFNLFDCSNFLFLPAFQI